MGQTNQTFSNSKSIKKKENLKELIGDLQLQKISENTQKNLSGLEFDSTKIFQQIDYTFCFKNLIYFSMQDISQQYDSSIQQLEAEVEFPFSQDLFTLFMLNSKEFYQQYFSTYKILNQSVHENYIIQIVRLKPKLLFQPNKDLKLVRIFGRTKDKIYFENLKSFEFSKLKYECDTQFEESDFQILDCNVGIFQKDEKNFLRIKSEIFCSSYNAKNLLEKFQREFFQMIQQLENDILQFIISLNYNSKNLIWFKNSQNETVRIMSENIIKARNLKQNKEFNIKQFKFKMTNQKFGKTNTLTQDNKQLRTVKILEVFRDGNVNDFEQLLKKNDMKKILQIKDQQQKTPLHIVCQHGFQDLAQRVIELHRKYQLDLDPLDYRNDTPLMVLFSHGTDEEIQNIEDTQQQIKYKKMLQAKYVISKMMLDKKETIRADIKKSVQPKKNNPMHWAVYYGASQAGRLILQEFPLIILRKNRQGLTPLELIVKKLIRKDFKFFSKEFTRLIMRNFIEQLVENKNDAQKQKEFFINSSAEEQQFFKELQKQYSNKENLMKLHNIIKNVKTIWKNDSSEQESFSIYKKKDSNKVFAIEKISDKSQDKEDDNSFEKISDEESEQNKIREQRKTKNDALQKLFVSQNKKEVLKIYNHKIKTNKKNPYLIFVHKIFLIAIYLDQEQIVDILLKNFKISPFFKSMDDMSAILFACKKGRFQYVRKFISFDYQFDQGKIFSWKKEINRRGGIQKNSCLHFVAIRGDKQMYQELVDIGADINKFNYLDFRPYELASKIQLKFLNEKLQSQVENEHLLEKIKDPLSYKNFDKKLMELISQDYIYLIVARDVEKQVNNTLVYKQLKNLSKRFEDVEASLFNNNDHIQDEEVNNIKIDNIKFKHFLPVQNKQQGHYRHYFVLQFSDILIKAVASYLGFEIFNKKKKYITQFQSHNYEDFHQFRDYHIHEIIHFVLNKEFDVEQYKKIQVIEDAFPLHDFKTRQNIIVNWKKERKTVIFDPLKWQQTMKDIRPFNSIAFYFGCDVSLYISYTLLMTSFLMILGVIGLLLFIIITTMGPSLYINAAYSIAVTIWVAVVLEKWKKRENIHADIWNADTKKNNEIKLQKYKGDYEIDKITKSVEKKNLWSIYRRRLFVSQKD